MLPPFGFILVLLYPDGSNALRAWADTTEPLETMADALREQEDDGVRIVVAAAADYQMTLEGTEWRVAPRAQAQARVYTLRKRG